MGIGGGLGQLSIVRFWGRIINLESPWVVGKGLSARRLVGEATVNWKSSTPSLLIVLGLAIMLNAYRPILERIAFAWGARIPIHWTTTDVLTLLGPPIALVAFVVLLSVFKRRSSKSK